jgi:hypothetical protein
MSNTARVEQLFKNFPDQTHTLRSLMAATGLTGDQVRGAISYLNAKAKAGNAIAIECVERGKRWRYVLDKPKRGKASIGERLDAAERATKQGRQAKREFAGWCDVPDPCVNKTGHGIRHQKRPDCGPMFGPAQAARLLDAQGHEDKPVGRNDFARLTAELGQTVLAKEMRLRLVGTTPEGYAIGVDDGTGNTFKVVPV